MKFISQGKYQLIIVSLLLLGVGFWVGQMTKNAQLVSSVREGQVMGKEVHQGGYKYINPLLYYEMPAAELQPFQHTVEGLVEELQRSGKASDIAVYFRDLNNGPWYGINEHEPFSPASLLKVPLMIAYFRQAETNPQLLEETIIYIPGSNPEPTTLEANKQYTVNQLIDRMIIVSDNEAKNILSNYKSNIWLETYTDLGINIPLVRGLDDNMSVKDYAAFLRVLYNASYLNRERSSAALALLTRTTFNDGLRAGVPENIEVAHKFGERVIDEKIKQLHDCGIVYHSRHPYLLCIMTRGENIGRLGEVIRQVSDLVYKEVDRQSR